MRTTRCIETLTAFALLVVVSASRAQSDGNGVYWHLDPSVKSCSMMIDPSLTQDQWHHFTAEAGAILTYKSLASAATLGKMKFKVAVDYSSTPVDQHDLGWINTFTHPDENCPLGDAIVVPTLRAAFGVSDHWDVGAYWTTAAQANYGGVGGEVKYAFLQESERRPSAAARASVSILTGVPDFNFGIYSLDLMTGKRFAMFSPYLGIKESLLVATETTSKVSLDQENVMLTQGYAGVACSVWKFALAAEYDVSTVNTFVVSVGMGR